MDGASASTLIVYGNLTPMAYPPSLFPPSNDVSRHSNERMNGVKKPSKNPREVIKTIAPNHKVFSTIKDLPWPLKNRHFIYEGTWTRNSDGSFIFAYRPPFFNYLSDGVVNLGGNTSRQLVKAETRVFVVIKPTGERSLDSCDVTWVQKLDGKGSIPPKIMEKIIPRSLQLVSQVREKFSRDDEIDRIEQEKLTAIMQNADNKEGGEVYDKIETQLIKEVQQQMKKAGDDIFRPLSR